MFRYFLVLLRILDPAFSLLMDLQNAQSDKHRNIELQNCARGCGWADSAAPSPEVFDFRAL